MVIRPFGQSALLAEVGSLDEVLALHRRLVRSVPDGVLDLVPAARTVLITFEPRAISATQVRAFVRDASDAADPPDAAPPLFDLDIAYDGPDLHDTADVLGVSPEALVAAHRDAEWTVAFTGFAPGFGYLTSPQWPYSVPRLESPRTRVPAGAVGLAGEFSGAYPRETPGGWRLIGMTKTVLFDPTASAPALLSPGARVRFRPKAPAIRSAPPQPDVAALRVSTGIPARSRYPESAHRRRSPGLRVIERGLLATVQDLGRPGHASVGIAQSGALDRGALRTANRLLGNPEGAAAIEVTMGGFRAVAERDLWFAVAGAWGDIRLGDQLVDPYQAHPWRSGTELHLDWFAHGARSYLAIRGGIDAPEVVGSRASDVLAGLGLPPLDAGDVLAVAAAPPDEKPELAYAPWGPPEDTLIDARLAPGPRADWFSSAASDLLYFTEWTVSNDADRVGIRLDGPKLLRSRSGELPSEGMVPGAIQVPPSGHPVILGADGPVTGGYPVIAVVADADRDLLAQARPGTRLRFRHARAEIAGL